MICAISLESKRVNPTGALYNIYIQDDSAGQHFHNLGGLYTEPTVLSKHVPQDLCTILGGDRRYEITTSMVRQEHNLCGRTVRFTEVKKMFNMSPGCDELNYLKF
jgi:hypothetical protein